MLGIGNAEGPAERLALVGPRNGSTTALPVRDASPRKGNAMAIMPPDGGNHYPRMERVLFTALQLVASPGWQGTVKVLAIMITVAAIYVGLHLLP